MDFCCFNSFVTSHIALSCSNPRRRAQPIFDHELLSPFFRSRDFSEYPRQTESPTATPRFVEEEVRSWHLNSSFPTQSLDIGRILLDLDDGGRQSVGDGDGRTALVLFCLFFSPLHQPRVSRVESYHHPGPSQAPRTPAEKEDPRSEAEAVCQILVCGGFILGPASWLSSSSAVDSFHDSARYNSRFCLDVLVIALQFFSPRSSSVSLALLPQQLWSARVEQAANRRYEQQNSSQCLSSTLFLPSRQSARPLVSASRKSYKATRN